MRAVLLFWWFAVASVSNGWLVMSPPTGPFQTKEDCENWKALLTPDDRVTNAKSIGCWSDGSVLTQGPPTWQ